MLMTDSEEVKGQRSQDPDGETNVRALLGSCMTGKSSRWQCPPVLQSLLLKG